MITYLVNHPILILLSYVVLGVGICFCFHRAILAGKYQERIERELLNRFLSEDLDAYVADFNGWRDEFHWTHDTECEFNRRRYEWAEERRAEATFDSRGRR